MSSVGCLIPSNADIAGVGVRIAVYVQNVLCFLPALWAIADEKITKYELDSMENMSTTNLVVAFGILISCFVQAPTLGLTNFHTSIVLSMSWMNNTNVFIYFLLYAARLRNRDGGWVVHLKDHVVSALHIRRFFPLPPPTDEEGLKNRGEEQVTPVVPAPASPEKIRLFRRVALVLGSLHLTLMSTLGLWLWSDPRGFGTADSACAIDHAYLAIAGASVAFGSQALRAFSLFIYGLFLVPGVNLLLPMAVFLGIYLVHGKFYPGAQQADSHEPQPQHDTSESTGKYVWSVAKRISSPKSPVFPAFAGLCFLLAINIIFIVDIELTLRNNGGIQEQGEAEWGFGQVLAVLLLFLPLRDLVEMIFRRRQELKTQVNTEMKRAINRRDIEGISRWAIAGANPEVQGEDGLIALEVVCVAGRWDILHILVENGTGLNTVFKDGRTALEVVVLISDPMNLWHCMNLMTIDGQTALEVATRASDWEGVRILVRLGADINTTFKDGQTALEAVIRASDWENVCILVVLGADINAMFQDGQKALEVATRASHRKGMLILKRLGADVNGVNRAGETAFEVATRAPDLECLWTLLKLGASINTVFSDGKTALEVVSVAHAWDILQFLVEKGVDVNTKFTDSSTALEAATLTLKWDILCVLITKGSPHSNVVFTNGSTALEVVSSPQNWDVLCAQRSMDKKTDLADGETVLEATIRTHDWEGAHVLGRLGARVSPMFKDTLGQASLKMAVHAREWKAARALAVLGWDIDSVVGDGQIEIETAIHAKDWERLRFLVGLKADGSIVFQDGTERTVLEIAVREQQWDRLLEIVDAGADVNMLMNGGRGDTPLHKACYRGHDKCTELLLKHRDPADPNAKNDYGRTPLHLAYECGRQGCIKLLLENGADESIKDYSDMTPSQRAQSS
ncbi:ankyrin [Coprinellus micaceus]|uniref:Ankyrin n=1 Tax=Coprinellus micaceus TaxID=71717 RepID=A0A4Y7SU40_COPMI|nr:ankyrin [Coprinellus micaceus]